MEVASGGKYSPLATHTEVNNCFSIQLFREGLLEKVHATIPNGNMGYDQYTVPDTVAFERTFVAFL